MRIETGNPRPGARIKIRTVAPPRASRGLYIRLEQQSEGGWRPLFDLAPRWEGTGPPHAKPAEGDFATGLLIAFRAVGGAVLRLPSGLADGRYRLRQRVKPPDKGPRDLVAEFAIK